MKYLLITLLLISTPAQAYMQLDPMGGRLEAPGHPPATHDASGGPISEMWGIGSPTSPECDFGISPNLPGGCGDKGYPNGVNTSITHMLNPGEVHQ